LINKTQIYGNLIGLGFFLAVATNSLVTGSLAFKARACLSPPSAVASVLEEQNPELKAPATAPAYIVKTNQFPKLEQPIGLKLAVIAVGLSLISAELWWFMFKD
jgi:hypothetical protein